MSIPGFTAESSVPRTTGTVSSRQTAILPAGTVVPAQGLDEICSECRNGQQFCRFFTTRMRCFHVPSDFGLGFGLECRTYKVATFKGWVPCFDSGAGFDRGLVRGI